LVVLFRLRWPLAGSKPQCVNSDASIYSDQARDALLTIAAGGGEAPLPAGLDQLHVDQWTWIVDCAGSNRVLPLLANWAKNFGSHELQDQIEASLPPAKHKQRMFRSLAQQRAMAGLSRELDQSGIRFVFLKGASLTLTAYADPKLRPMRDIDLLVDRENAWKARDIASSIGFSTAPHLAPHGLDDKHHLPVMVRDGLVSLEIHHRLSQRGWDGELALAEFLLERALRHPLADEQVSVADPVTNLLHLVAHAGISNLYDNGPQLLADMHYLAKQDPNWDEATALASQCGLERPLALALALFRRYGGEGATNTSIEVPQAWIEQASALMVHDREADWQRQRLRHSESWAAMAKRALLPRATSLATRAGRAHDDPRRWLAYPGWLIDRGRSIIAARFDRDLVRQAEEDSALTRWLLSDQEK